MPASASSSALAARQALADRLRELRLDAGLTARELASRAGWERTKVSKIEHGARPPSADNIRTWCRACGADGEAADLVVSLRAVEGMWVDAAAAARLERQRVLRRPGKTFAFLVEESVLRSGSAAQR